MNLLDLRLSLIPVILVVTIAAYVLQSWYSTSRALKKKASEQKPENLSEAS